jgi:hypothetical protein
MLLKSSRNLSTRTNGSSGLQIRNNQSMTKTTLTNSLPKTSPRHRKRRVTGRQRRTPENGVISTKSPGTTPMNVAQNSHWWSRSKTRSRTLIQNLILKMLVKDRSLTQTPLLLSRPQQFNQKNQQILKRGSALFHSQMWVKGTPLHFIVDSGSQKNLISAEVVKQLGLSTTPHPQPYNIGWLRQGRDLRVSQQCRLSYGIQPFKDEVLCDVSPLDVCDVLLGQPYMWKRHAIYESRPRSVIVTLGGHLYRIPEVVPTTVPPKKCRKVVSHTAKFSFFTICSKGEQKDTATTTASPQAPSIPQKQVDKAATKCKDSFCTPSSHVSRLVEQPQPQQVRDRLPQTEQRDVSSKASNSPRCRFNKRFSLSPGNSTQWRPLLPKEGGLIQMDIGGHPPFPTGSKQFSGNFGNLLFLAGFNFRGHFEGLNEGFSGSTQLNDSLKA